MKKSLLACLVAATCSMNVAAEEVKAEDLVDRFYGSINASRFVFDDNRVFHPGNGSKVMPDVGTEYGFGAAAGYRFNENWEVRFGYTDLNIQQTSGSTALDLLYFVNQANLYVIGGANYLEIEDDKMSLNIGAGYRHYYNKDIAVFAEGKAYYNPSSPHTDYSLGLGAMYFFGGSDSHEEMPVSEEAEAPLAASAAAASRSAMASDSDGDGVEDANDSCANTPSNVKVDASGCTEYSEEALTFELVVNFANNSSAVEAKYFEEIKRLADFMKTYAQTEVVIAGHTSTPGTEAYNQDLSERRATAIANVLSSNYGISSSRIETVGYGETRLRVKGDNEAAHAENRRIEAEVSGSVKKAIQR